jgi:two-component sensor histidine kinase
MKHAFPNGAGKIGIDFRESGGVMELCYRDTGVGLGEAADPGNPKSLGLQLINDLVAQLKGTLQYRYAEGAVFLLSFPTVCTDGTG